MTGRVLNKDALEAFMNAYLGHYMPTGQADWHREFKQNLVIGLASDTKTAILAPRGHAKSTIVTLGLALMSAALEVKSFILIVSDTGPQAASMMAAIIGELDENERLLRDFPGLERKMINGRPVADRDNDIALANGVRIVARGAGSSMRGMRHRQHRPDLIIIDDLENDEAVNTDYQRDKLRNWFNTALMNVAGPTCSVVMVGTLLHYDALLADVMKRPGWRHFTYYAMQKDGQPSRDFEDATWPEYWTPAALRAKIEEIGLFAFNREFLHDPVNEDEALFRQGWLKYYHEHQVKIVRKALAIDPAFSKDQKNDESALAVLGTDAAGNIYLVDWWAGRVSSAALREQIERLIGLHKPAAIGAESVQAQVWLVEALREMGYPCQKLQPDKDKVRRAENLSIRYQNGTVYHRYQDRDSAFELQLLRFPKGKHDDLVDAAVYAEMLLFRYKGASIGRPKGRIARPSAGARPKLPAANG